MASTFSDFHSLASSSGSGGLGAGAGGTCGGASSLPHFTAASAFHGTQQCQSTSAIGCFHGACCVLLLDGDSLTLDDEHRYTLLALVVLWALCLFGSFLLFPAIYRRRYHTNQGKSSSPQSVAGKGLEPRTPAPGTDLSSLEDISFQRIGRIPRKAKLVSSFLLVLTSIVLVDALCRCAATVSDYGSESATGSQRTASGKGTVSGQALQRSTHAVCQVWLPFSHYLPPPLTDLLPSAADGSYAVIIALGMIFGFFGDILFPISAAAAIGSFAVGHIFYLTAFTAAMDTTLDYLGTNKMPAALQPKLGAAGGGGFRSGGGAEPRTPREHLQPFLMGLRVLFLFVTFTRAWIPLKMYRHSAAIKWVSFAYCFVMAETASKGIALALVDPVHFLLVGVGVSLFVLSDIAVGWAAFAGKTTYFGLNIGDYIWLTYGPAQCFIVFSSHALWLSMQQTP